MIRLACRPNYFVVSSDVLKADLFSFHFPPTIPHKENQPLCLANIETEVSESVCKSPQLGTLHIFLATVHPTQWCRKGGGEGNRTERS